MSKDGTFVNGEIRSNSNVHALNAPANTERQHLKSVASETNETLVLIDPRVLNRECIAQSLLAHSLDMEIQECGSVEEWQNIRQSDSAPTVALLNIGNRKINTDEALEELREIVESFGPTPVVVLADNDDLSHILQVLDCGTRGYIPTSLGIRICVEAIRLASVGGTFVPVSSVLAMRQYIKPKREAAEPMAGMFTERQAQVVQALRLGKANKIIAYELNLRESTVKVHIRNIMKKIKATNRTEVAYKINKLLGEDAHFPQ